MRNILMLAAVGTVAYLIVKRASGGGNYSEHLTVRGQPVPDDFNDYASTRGLIDNPSGADVSADAEGAST